MTLQAQQRFEQSIPRTKDKPYNDMVPQARLFERQMDDLADVRVK